MQAKTVLITQDRKLPASFYLKVTVNYPYKKTVVVTTVTEPNHQHRNVNRVERQRTARLSN